MASRPEWSGFGSANELFEDQESVLVDIRAELTIALTHLNKAVAKAQGSSDPTAQNFMQQTVSIRESVQALIRRLSHRYP